MQNFMLELGTSTKKLFREKINIVILLLLLIFSLEIYNTSVFHLKTTRLENSINKKIDHRYFNTTTTLEEIFNVKINTHNGELKVKY